MPAFRAAEYAFTHTVATGCKYVNLVVVHHVTQTERADRNIPKVFVVGVVVDDFLSLPLSHIDHSSSSTSCIQIHDSIVVNNECLFSVRRERDSFPVSCSENKFTVVKRPGTVKEFTASVVQILVEFTSIDDITCGREFTPVSLFAKET